MRVKAAQSMIPGKDRPASETIENIRSILQSLGMDYEEEWIVQRQKASFSVRLALRDSLIGVNGKGLTREAALASALGEWMERLQNELLLPPWQVVRAPPLATIHPDAVWLDAGDFSAAECSALATLLAASTGGKNTVPPRQTSPGNTAELFVAAENGGAVLCHPYYCPTLGAIIRMPRGVLELTGSNGMCAGNTPEEALVQGLSEIAERDAHRRFLDGSATLGRVSDADIGKHYPDLHSRKCAIESGGDVGISFYLVNGAFAPVFCCLVLGRDQNAYSVAFGSHPHPLVGMTRSFTEALQGKTPDALPNRRKHDGTVDFQQNMRSLLMSGTGRHPETLFQVANRAMESDIVPPPYASNKRLLRSLLDNLSGRLVLLRSVGYLGFPAFHVIVCDCSAITPPHQKRQQRRDAARLAFEILAGRHNGVAAHLPFLIEYADYLLRTVDSRRSLAAICPPLGTNLPDFPDDLCLFAALGRVRAGDENGARERLEQASRLRRDAGLPDPKHTAELLAALRNGEPDRNYWDAFFQKRFLDEIDRGVCATGPDNHGDEPVFDAMRRNMAEAAARRFPQQTPGEFGL